MHKVLDINHYLQDGFYRIADVEPQLGNATKWNFINQHPDLYSEHRCWVYMIVDGNEVVKIGETGQPLGIRKIRDDQPQITTECRFGRLRGAGGKDRNMDGTYTDTDMRIREELQESVSRGTVSIYAKQCDETVMNGVDNSRARAAEVRNQTDQPQNVTNTNDNSSTMSELTTGTGRRSSSTRHTTRTDGSVGTSRSRVAQAVDKVNSQWDNKLEEEKSKAEREIQRISEESDKKLLLLVLLKHAIDVNI